ncbi:MAG: hypothetical protein ACTSWX_09405 [Promethearchaeota archaeon]
MLDETCRVIVEEIQNRNTNKNVLYQQAIEEIRELPTFPTLLMEVDLQNVADKNHILTINRIQVSLSELEEGILEKYKTAVLIIVGHGTQDGLSDKKNIMPWEVVQEVIEDKKAELTFIASCFGAKATHDVNNAYGFVGEVDFQVASYVALSILFDAMGESSLSKVYYNLAISRFFLLAFNPEYGKYLRIVGGGGGGGYTPFLSSTESGYWYVMIMITCLMLLMNLAISAVMKVTIMELMQFNVIIGGGAMVLSLTLLITDDITFGEAAAQVIGCFVDFLGFFINWIFNSATPEQKALFAGAFVLSLIAFIAENSISAFAAAIISVVLSIATFIAISYSIEQDKTDYNDYVG